MFLVFSITLTYPCRNSYEKTKLKSSKIYYEKCQNYFLFRNLLFIRYVTIDSIILYVSRIFELNIVGK